MMLNSNYWSTSQPSIRQSPLSTSPSLHLSTLSLADMSGFVPMTLRIKILKEMIPKSYDDLRKRIEEMVVEARVNKDQPLLHKDVFW